MLWKRRNKAPPAVVGQSAAPSRSATRVNKYGFELSAEQMAAGEHRKRVGPLWDEIGALQFDYLVSQGLKPGSCLLDVGCGALRGGLHFVRYLEPAHYYGIDINSSLLRAGLEHEIPAAGLEDKLPAANLQVSDRFDATGFGRSFDYLLAQSVFTHLPLNHIRLCLYRAAKVTEPGARFFATFFEASEDVPYDKPVKQVTATTHPDRDSYHYRRSELEWAATVGPWKFHYHGDWGHPRGQRMVEYERA